MIVHLPIGLILLVPVLELLGGSERRRELRTAAGLVLALATVAALLAEADGWLLAWSGGYKGTLVYHHMWTGVWVGLLCMVCCTLRWRAKRWSAASVARLQSSLSGPNAVGGHARPKVALHPGQVTKRLERCAPRSVGYCVSLALTLAIMAWASHLGGSLSHGDNYLTQYLPAPLKRFFRVAPAKPAAAAAVLATGGPTVYAQRIQPIFDHSCVSCHGPEKVKGGFRLDTYAALMKGGDNGADVVPWQPAKSEILRRVHLEPDDDDFMPSNGKNVLTDAQKALIEKWIAAGASDRQPLLDR